MKAKELMIGDWVSYRNEPRMVTTVSTDWVGLDFGTEIEADESEVEPIRLTHTSLKSNLTYENETEDGRYYSIDDSTLWGVFKSGKFWLCFNGQQDMIGIRFVHELQHALRMCGLDEVADDFMIS